LFDGDLRRMYSCLRAFRNAVRGRTFVDGLAYTLAEILYNYLGYVMDSSSEGGGPQRWREERADGS
jgi:hypothetical protein